MSRNYRLLSLFLFISFFSSCELFYPPEFFNLVGNDKKNESTNPGKKTSPPPKYWTNTFAPLGTGIHHLGQSVSISGDGSTLVGGDDYLQTVYLYRQDSAAASWIPLSSITGLQAQDSDSSDGNTLAAGAYLDNSYKGGAYVYQWNTSTLSWDNLTLSSPITGINANDYLGVSISLSGDGKTLAAGANGYPSGSFFGKVYVYRYDGSVWQETTASNSLVGNANSDKFGFSVSLSDDGSYLAVGAPNYNSLQGNAFIYHWDGIVWSEVTNFPGGSVENFGFSTALNGDATSLAVGANNYNVNQGKTYLYQYK